MNDVTVHVERWSRHTCRQLYLCTLDVDVNEEVRDAFCFSWLDYGVIWAVIDDFGDLVPLGPRQERWLRLYWAIGELEAIEFERRYAPDSDHVPPWAKSS